MSRKGPMASQSDIEQQVLAQIVAREQIRDLVSRYNSNGDTGRIANVRELFCADAVMRIGRTEVHEGLDQIMSVFTGAGSRQTGRSGPTYVRHFTATHQIDLIDDTYATGRLYFAVITDIGLDHWGVYTDTYRVDDGRWKFASRKVVLDGRSPNSLFPAVD